MASRAAIIVIAKAPRPGLVKTRMSPPLSLEQASDLYANLLADVLAATAEFAARLGLDPSVSVYPPDACRQISRLAPATFRVVAQRGRDLGERLRWAAAEAAAAGADRILIRGSDSPTLDGKRVENALDSLEHDGLVLCPDLDGGYCLIGLRRPAAELFAPPMSTDSVLSDTLSVADSLGLAHGMVEPCFDLDTVGDLRELARARLRGDTLLCPRTLAFLDERALWVASQRSGAPDGGSWRGS